MRLLFSKKRQARRRHCSQVGFAEVVLGRELGDSRRRVTIALLPSLTPRATAGPVDTAAGPDGATPEQSDGPAGPPF